MLLRNKSNDTGAGNTRKADSDIGFRSNASMNHELSGKLCHIFLRQLIFKTTQPEGIRFLRLDLGRRRRPREQSSFGRVLRERGGRFGGMFGRRFGSFEEPVKFRGRGSNLLIRLSVLVLGGTSPASFDNIKSGSESVQTRSERGIIIGSDSKFFEFV